MKRRIDARWYIRDVRTPVVRTCDSYAYLKSPRHLADGSVRHCLCGYTIDVGALTAYKYSLRRDTLRIARTRQLMRPVCAAATAVTSGAPTMHKTVELLTARSRDPRVMLPTPNCR